jgi:hypothetical protein
VVHEKQEVIQLQISDSNSFSVNTSAMNSSLELSYDTVIRLTVRDTRTEITNAAAGENIANTINALQRLC